MPCSARVLTLQAARMDTKIWTPGVPSPKAPQQSPRRGNTISHVFFHPLPPSIHHISPSITCLPQSPIFLHHLSPSTTSLPPSTCLPHHLSLLPGSFCSLQELSLLGAARTQHPAKLSKLSWTKGSQAPGEQLRSAEGLLLPISLVKPETALVTCLGHSWPFPKLPSWLCITAPIPTWCCLYATSLQH